MEQNGHARGDGVTSRRDGRAPHPDTHTMWSIVGAGCGPQGHPRLRPGGPQDACINKVFRRARTRWPLRAASPRRSATWAGRLAWHTCITVKGADWLGDQDAIGILCRNARGVYGGALTAALSRTDAAASTTPFGGMTPEYGEAPRRAAYCAAADAAGQPCCTPSMRQSLKNRRVLHEYFAIDLMMIRRRLPCVVA